MPLSFLLRLQAPVENLFNKAQQMELKADDLTRKAFHPPSSCAPLPAVSALPRFSMPSTPGDHSINPYVSYSFHPSFDPGWAAQHPLGAPVQQGLTAMGARRCWLLPSFS